MTLVSVAQMNSQDDIELNFVVIEQLMQQSQAAGASLIVFPENFVCFAGGKQRQTAEQFEVIQIRLEQLAHRYGLWIVAGTLPCPYRPDGSIIQDGRVRTVRLCISTEKLKHVMTKFIYLMSKWAMQSVVIKSLNTLNPALMSLSQKRLLATLV